MVLPKSNKNEIYIVSHFSLKLRMVVLSLNAVSQDHNVLPNAKYASAPRLK